MRTAAVLPVKSFGRAKQRLGAAVGQPDRGELAAAMARRRARCAAGDRRAGGADRRDGGAARGGRGTAGGRARGRRSRSRRASRTRLRAACGRRCRAASIACCSFQATARRSIPARSARCWAALTGAGLVIVPDRHGSGTNALLIAPPYAVPPAFGPGSFARHAALGAAAGVVVRVAQAPSLELDVDTPGDLAALRAGLAARADVRAADARAARDARAVLRRRVTRRARRTNCASRAARAMTAPRLVAESRRTNGGIE